jgi:chromosome segregation ATPase
MSGRLQEGRYVALQARAEHAETELLKQMRERKAAEQWRDLARQRAERAEQNCAEMKEATRSALEIVEPMRDNMREMLAENEQLRARVADLETRLAGPTQTQRDDEADMRAFMVGG